MADKTPLLPLDEAKQAGLRFIRAKFYQGQVTIDEPRLVTEGELQVYHLTGTIKTPVHGGVSRIFLPAAEYILKMQLNARDGSILSYELS